MVQLPYFDRLIEQLNQNNPQTVDAFGRHVHWGYWSNPALADGSIANFALAAEELCQRVCNAGKPQDGLRILDAGCGFGGTIASLNERFSNLELVGINIDERQIARARDKVLAQNNNQIEFVCGDACELPFADNSFDVVYAVECIFHFPSRERFFAEVRRVLRPGGRLAISDFVPPSLVFPALKLVGGLLHSSVAPTYGSVDSSYTIADYRKLAQKLGFTLTVAEDITANTLPTYPVVKKIFSEIGTLEDANITGTIELASRWRFLLYWILGFEVK
jgi:ubiquinone/menaquinone biosynthesis C-methylase UbiE